MIKRLDIVPFDLTDVDSIRAAIGGAERYGIDDLSSSRSSSPLQSINPPTPSCILIFKQAP